MIGVLGGTFDPIHNGHLRLALEIQTALDLEIVKLIPVHYPLHRDPPLADSRVRLQMLEIAIQDQPGLMIDQRELNREGPSYTVDTLTSLRQEIDNEPLCLILGMDAFRGISEWHHPEMLAGLTHLVVGARPGYKSPHSIEIPESGFVQATDAADLKGRCCGLILFQAITALDISASAIRTLIAAGKPPRYLLPEGVLRFIEEQRLYH